MQNHFEKKVGALDLKIPCCCCCCCSNYPFIYLLIYLSFYVFIGFLFLCFIYFVHSFIHWFFRSHIHFYIYQLISSFSFCFLIYSHTDLKFYNMTRFSTGGDLYSKEQYDRYVRSTEMKSLFLFSIILIYLLTCSVINSFI